ncbi:ParB/RepB/Spo0J family partition protein [Patescibacteria group bacterium AH-259-L05]|nr:ParB/RepB/Spo0J family partition protein [Patescibacteria group bacterium AH-259-L05]
MPLGRGLGSLIPAKIIQKQTEEVIAQTGEQVLHIPVHSIEPNPDQPRKYFGHMEMEELMNSIQEYGIIQPLIVTKIGENAYQIIAGERRWRAAQVLELETVPAIVRSVEKSQKLELSLIENIQRKDLNPMERARAYRRLIDEFNFTQVEVGKKLGKARPSIANTLRLLTLDEVIQGAIEQEKITEGHAKVLLTVEDEKKQKALLKRILGTGLTVRETEKLTRGKRVRKSIELDPALLEYEQELARALDTKVKIIKTEKKSKIIIEAYSDKDLEEIIKKIVK